MLVPMKNQRHKREFWRPTQKGEQNLAEWPGSGGGSGGRRGKEILNGGEGHSFMRKGRTLRTSLLSSKDHKETALGMTQGLYR